jgi:hypothetical protein
VYYTQITDFGLDFPIIYTFKKAKSINWRISCFKSLNVHIIYIFNQFINNKQKVYKKRNRCSKYVA